MSIRTIALPALALSLLLTVGGNAATASADAPTDPTTTTAPALPTGDVPVSVAATGSQDVALATPSTSGAPATVYTPGLKLDSYDQQSGEAVLASGDAADPNAAAASQAASSVQAGQLIDSPPTPAAQQGALVAVTAVRAAGDGKVAVSTRPATLSELLGRIKAYGRSAIDPHTIQVHPLVKDLKASFTGQNGDGNGSVSATLHLDANAPIALPGGASGKLDGSLDLTPVVDFSYQGAVDSILKPQKARVGFDLGAHANWHVNAELGASATPIKVPLATFTASPVLMVGQVPVVVTLNLTLTAQISADGKVTVDTQQDITGNWGVHADYTRDQGWTTATDPASTTVSPVRVRLAGTASVRTGLIADASVALYDTVGVKADIEPYLRSTVDGSLAIDSSGAPPVIEGQAALYGGIDVNGGLLVRIPFLGPLFEKDVTFPVLHREWPIVKQSISTGTDSTDTTTDS
ncbi:hypothetical protein ACFWJ4_26615 [Kitasatospora sp. NPDC127067]|uniref:hypothetical protein n=1 Tax=Kitasatospora sp. NPDC127067 TaxID=3347126 RepID=UPI0036597B95